MKMVIKTLGWALISAAIFMVGAIIKGCPVDAAIAGAALATIFKTPAYPAWEWVFARLYGVKECGCNANKNGEVVYEG